MFIKKFLLDLPCQPMGYFQSTSQSVDQQICIFIIMQVVFCNLVSIKCIIVHLFTLISQLSVATSRDVVLIRVLNLSTLKKNSPEIIHTNNLS